MNFSGPLRQKGWQPLILKFLPEEGFTSLKLESIFYLFTYSFIAVLQVLEVWHLLFVQYNLRMSLIHLSIYLIQLNIYYVYLVVTFFPKKSVLCCYGRALKTII